MGKIVATFPGQGSQFVGMGADFIGVDETFTRSMEASERALGRPLVELCLSGPAEALTETSNAQPAIMAVSLAALDLLLARGFTFDACMGHSLGEFAALVAAGALPRREALVAVVERGALMSSAGHRSPGAMAALIGMELDAVRALCESVGELVVANVNAPGQVVVSGNLAAVARAVVEAPAAGAKRVIRLNVSAAFHSPLMESVADEFSRYMEEKLPVASPRVPVYQNVTGRAARSAEGVRAALKEQLRSPVLFVDMVESAVRDGGTEFVEIGPGTVLTNLTRRIAPSVSAVSWADFVS